MELLMLIRSPKELAMLITNKRKKLKLSQTEVANLVGLKQKTISAFENKPENLKLDTLFLVLSALELDLNIASKSNNDIRWKEEW